MSAVMGMKEKTLNIKETSKPPTGSVNLSAALALKTCAFKK